MSTERKRTYDRERQCRLYTEGRSYKQLHPENQQVCDRNRARTLKREVSQMRAYHKHRRAVLQAERERVVQELGRLEAREPF